MSVLTPVREPRNNSKARRFRKAKAKAAVRQDAVMKRFVAGRVKAGAR